MSTIYIVSDAGRLQKKTGILEHYSIEGTITKIFPYKTDQLVIIGNIVITGPALKLLMHYNIDTVFIGKNGKFNGKIVFRQNKNVFIRKKQYLLTDNEQFKINFCKSVVKGKLKNQLTFMQRINRKGKRDFDIENNITGIKNILTKIRSSKSGNEIRGFEGIGAKYFFSVFRYNIIPDWAVFRGRSMHPPKDNVNAVLSFLYTLLFHRIDGIIESESLDSHVGYLHELCYGRRSLSYDLIEEFRTPIADTLCCSLFNRGVLNPEDFENVTFSKSSDEYPLSVDEDNLDKNIMTVCEDKKGILLTKKATHKVISHFEKKIEDEVFYNFLKKHISYKKIMREQVKHFKRVINGEEELYQPLTIK